MSYFIILYITTSITHYSVRFFPSELKKADIIPIHKERVKSDTDNYCLIGILPILSKIYESCIFDQYIFTSSNPL